MASQLPSRLAVIARRGVVSLVAAAALVGAGSGVASAAVPAQLPGVPNVPVVGSVLGNLPTGGLLGGTGTGTGSLPSLPTGIPGLPSRSLPDPSTIPGVTLPAGSGIPSVGGTASPSVDLSDIQNGPTGGTGNVAVNLPPGFPTIPTIPGIVGPCGSGVSRVCVASSDGTAESATS